MTILIVLYNNEKTILKTLNSIKKNNLGFKLNFVLIDNASKDKSLKLALNFFKKNFQDKKKRRLIVKKNDLNLGLAKALNQGLKIIDKNFKSKFLLILNPDVLLCETCVKNLYHCLKSSKKKAVSAKIYLADKTKLWFKGAKIDFIRFKTLHNNLNHCDYLPLCVVLFDYSIFKKMTFDKNFFLYYEDCDFFSRLKKQGTNFGVCDEAIAFHDESHSSLGQNKQYYLVYSALIFFEKHYPKAFKFYFWLGFYARFFYHKYFSKKPVVLKAFNDFYKFSKSA
ncbi:MAG: glycosyltransferase [Candidatus Moranbacteria bacterium]|nr:glycosyltransferase [Candidatus Moranbacteria bacterium]